MGCRFWVLIDVPKAQGDQKVIIMLIHVCDGFQISLNKNETIVLPQWSGSLKHSALYHWLSHLLISIIIFVVKFFIIVRCNFMSSSSESKSLLLLQPPCHHPFGNLKKILSPWVFRDPPTPDPLLKYCKSLNSPEIYHPFFYILHSKMMFQAVRRKNSSWKINERVL